jgi:hypothetical protein
MARDYRYQAKRAASSIVTALLAILVSIVVILNFASEIGGGIWLAILGDWKSIIVGLVISICMPFAFTIVTLPSTGLGMILFGLINKGRKIPAAILGFINMIYTNVVIAIWVVMVFGYFVERAKGRSIIPYLLWGYGTMMAPLSYMASKDGPEGTPANTLALTFAQLCYLISVAFYLLARSRTPWLLYSLAIGVTVFSLISVVLSISEMQKENTENEG